MEHLENRSVSSVALPSTFLKLFEFVGWLSSVRVRGGASQFEEDTGRSGRELPRTVRKKDKADHSGARNLDGDRIVLEEEWLIATFFFQRVGVHWRLR